MTIVPFFTIDSCWADRTVGFLTLAREYGIGPTNLAVPFKMLDEICWLLSFSRTIRIPPVATLGICWTGGKRRAFPSSKQE